MNIFYYNEAFNTQDGSSGHALGLLSRFREHADVNEIATFPSIGVNRPQPPAGSRAGSAGLSFSEQLLRFTKRTVQSTVRCNRLSRQLQALSAHEHTVQLARVSLFDSAPCMLSNKLNIPLVAEWNSPYFYEFGTLRNASLLSLCKHWERTFLQRSDLIYTVSNQINKMLMDEYKLPESKFLAVPNGYDPAIYPQSAESYANQRVAVRTKNNWNNKTVVAFIGSLKIWHGIGDLVKIADHFSGRNKNLHFVIMGDGEDRKVVQAGSQRLDNLEWMGSLPPSEMAEFLTGCDLGIMPYMPMDNFYFSPLKLYDMIGAGLPSIALATGQIKEVYQDHPEAGWGIPDGTPEAYIAMIEHLHNHKSEIEAKRERLLATREKHTWSQRADRLVGSFRGIPAKNRPLR